jgi:hypothetical protein
MCTCARPYGRAGRCGFGGRGVTRRCKPATSLATPAGLERELELPLVASSQALFSIRSHKPSTAWPQLCSSVCSVHHSHAPTKLPRQRFPIELQALKHVSPSDLRISRNLPFLAVSCVAGIAGRGGCSSTAPRLTPAGASSDLRTASNRTLGEPTPLSRPSPAFPSPESDRLHHWPPRDYIADFKVFPGS